MTDQQLPEAGQDLRDRAIARLKQKRDFGVHLFVYLVVNSFLIGIWAFTGAGFFWPAFPLFLWGIGLVLNAWDVYGPKPCPRTGSAKRWSACSSAMISRLATQPGLPCRRAP